MKNVIYLILIGFVFVAGCNKKTEPYDPNKEYWDEYWDPSLAVIVRVNPVMNDWLLVQCRTVELGKHTLELIDVLGNTTLLEEFIAEQKYWIFDFEIPMQSYAIGTYELVMNAPSGKRYTTKFILQR